MPDDFQPPSDPPVRSTECSAAVKPAIYAEHYSHTACECYKTDLPWTRYRKHTLVLCPVSDGIEEARRIAKRELRKHMLEAINVEPQNDQAHPTAAKATVDGTENL